MADLDAAIGYVVARGDTVERARLSWLRAGIVPGPDLLKNVERGEATGGGFAAMDAAPVGSVDATCFRLAELDDLGALDRPIARRGLDWLVERQGQDGLWEEDASLADQAPPWAKPGDPEAKFYLSTNAAFWLGAAMHDAAPNDPIATNPSPYAEPFSQSAFAIRDLLGDDGKWPGFLVSGWLAAAVLYRAEWFYESARIMVTLADRVDTMSAADVAWMTAAMRRLGVSATDSLLVKAKRRLTETQRSDGSWPSDDGPVMDVHTTLMALRALRD